MAKDYPESWRGHALRHFLVIVTQHFESNRSMAALVEGYTSAWAVLGAVPSSSLEVSDLDLVWGIGSVITKDSTV